MADIVIPQTNNSILGFWSNYWAVGQSFTATSSNLSSVTFTLDIASPYNGYVNDVSYRIAVVNLANNQVIHTSQPGIIARLPNETSNYYNYSQAELRDVTMSLGDVGVTVGGNYAVFVQFDVAGNNQYSYLAFAGSPNNVYQAGSSVYTESVHLQSGYASSVYSYGNWDYKMTLKGGVSNAAPVAVADLAAALEDGGAISINVLANDTDSNVNDTKTVVSVDASGATGTTFVNANGTVSYNPGAAFQSLAQGATATDAFTYTMRDTAGATSSASVTVTVTGVNDAVVAVADTAAATEDGAPVVIAVLANDTDVDAGDTKAIASVDTAATTGTVSINADGSVSYATGAAFQALGAGATATDSFSYTVRDGAGATSTATAIVTVTGVNDVPAAVGDSASVLEDQSVTINVLGNDTDVDAGDAMSIVSVSASSQGASVAIVNGQIVYTADADAQDLLVAGESTVDIVTYVMADRAGAQSTATVNVTVAGVANGANIVGTNKSDAALNGTVADESIDGGNGDDVISGLAGADVIYGGNGNDKLLGGQGIDKLFGDNGSDILVGGAGNDFLTGGNGVDVFVFEAGFGNDVITDFKSQNDSIQIARSLLADFTAVKSHASQVGADVVIAIDAANTITLVGVTLDSLLAKDFIFA